jgi:hypothetical protein
MADVAIALGGIGETSMCSDVDTLIVGAIVRMRLVYTHIATPDAHGVPQDEARESYMDKIHAIGFFVPLAVAPSGLVVRSVLHHRSPLRLF